MPAESLLQQKDSLLCLPLGQAPQVTLVLTLFEQAHSLQWFQFPLKCWWLPDIQAHTSNWLFNIATGIAYRVFHPMEVPPSKPAPTTTSSPGGISESSKPRSSPSPRLISITSSLSGFLASSLVPSITESHSCQRKLPNHTPAMTLSRLRHFIINLWPIG